MTDKLSDGHVWIDVVAGREGPSLNVGDDNDGYRLAGPKPWGGGRTVHRFMVRLDELVREANALAASPAPAIPAVDPVAIIEQCAVLAATHSQYPVETDFDHGYAKARRDAAHSIRALKAASAISESEDALLTAARRAIPALAHAAERNPAYQRDYEELSKAIEDAARKRGGS
ncbi:hypothetical protein [Burkholderia gladioli]|uniref:hypothetical protein n=1 Tax=Burkholderia gladioli TaxID=28095 RepID=UPI003EE380C9